MLDSTLTERRRRLNCELQQLQYGAKFIFLFSACYLQCLINYWTYSRVLDFVKCELTNF
jgi:hypothetical protein